VVTCTLSAARGLEKGNAVEDVGDAQIDEAVHTVQILRGFEDHFGLVGRRAATGIENNPGVGELDVAGIFRLDHFAAEDADVEISRFCLILHGQEMRDEKALLGNRCMGKIHGAPCKESDPRERVRRAPDKRSYTPRANWQLGEWRSCDRRRTASSFGSSGEGASG